MRIKILIQTVAAALLGLILIPAPGQATCWICLFDQGQYYCQSVAGSHSNNCTPVWNQYCDISGSAYCPEDGCSCQRFPDPPGKNQSADIHRNSLGVLLFQAANGNANAQLLATLAQAPVILEVGDVIVTPDVAVSAIMKHDPAVMAGEFTLAGYTAVTQHGPTVSRILDQDNTGLLVDARGSGGGQHVRISQLVARSIVRSSEELELSPQRAALVRVRLGNETYAAVIWARRLSGGSGADEAHRHFTEAANQFEARRIIEFAADSPDLRPFSFPKVLGVPSVWGSAFAFYR